MVPDLCFLTITRTRQFYFSALMWLVQSHSKRLSTYLFSQVQRKIEWESHVSLRLIPDDPCGATPWCFFLWSLIQAAELCRALHSIWFLRTPC